MELFQDFRQRQGLENGECTLPLQIIGLVAKGYTDIRPGQDQNAVLWNRKAIRRAQNRGEIPGPVREYEGFLNGKPFTIRTDQKEYTRNADNRDDAASDHTKIQEQTHDPEDQQSGKTNEAKPKSPNCGFPKRGYHFTVQTS